MAVPAYPKRRILVVDDQQAVCDALKMLLEFDEHEVKTTNSGKDALALFEQSKFDVVITDYAMPGMRGDELAAAIKEREPGQPVVMITAYADMLPGSGAGMKSVDHLMSKPFRLEDLREALVRVMKGQHPASNNGKH